MIRATRSLLLTGIADVWAAVREGQASEDGKSGLVLMVASAASFALMAAVVKALLPDTPTQAVVFSRGVIMTVAFGLLARRSGVSLRGTRTGMLVVRGLLGYAALSCYFYSVQHLHLGDAVLLQYSHPIYVAILAPWFLRERTRASHWAFVAAALVGVALIVRPGGALRPEALVGASGAVLSSLAYVAVRSLSRTEPPLSILVWFPLVSVVPSFFATLAAGPAALPRTSGEIVGHLAVAACALVGQITLTIGLSRTGAAKGTAVTLTGPVFGLVFGYAFFRQIPGAASLAGSALVLGSVAGLAWTTRASVTPPRPAPPPTGGSASP